MKEFKRDNEKYQYEDFQTRAYDKKKEPGMIDWKIKEVYIDWATSGYTPARDSETGEWIPAEKVDLGETEYGIIYLQRELEKTSGGHFGR